MSHPTRERLYDSEAALRLVDSALLDMTGEPGSVAEPVSTAPRPPADLTDFVAVVVQGYGELHRVLEGLRESRGALQRSSVDRLHQTHDKLREVSAATEVAATDILDGLERCSSMVDDLDGLAGTPDESTRGPEIRNGMRDELFALMGHMQFQDITSQQLAYASAVLSDMETRVARLVSILHPAMSEIMGEQVPALLHGAPWDPNATLRQREDRQAVADEIVASNAKAIG